VIYIGEEEAFDDGRGQVVQRDVPLTVCCKTAGALRRLGRVDLIVTDPRGITPAVVAADEPLAVLSSRALGFGRN